MMYSWLQSGDGYDHHGVGKMEVMVWRSDNDSDEEVMVVRL